MDGAVESNVNLGFGSKTVDPFSSPHVKNSIADWDEFGLMSPTMKNESRTEVEIPPSNLALVSSPPPLHFREMDEGDSVDEGGTRSDFPVHVRIRGLSQTPSRYAKNLSHSGVGVSFTPRSHSRLSSAVVEVVGEVDSRVSGRRGRDSPKVSGEEQRVQFRFSPTNIGPRVGKAERQTHRCELSAAATVGVTANHPILSPGSFPSDPEVRSCPPTPGALSPRTEVLSGSRISATICDDNNPSLAFRRRLRPDGLNEMMAEKTRAHAGVVDGYDPNERLSVAAVDGLDDGEEGHCWAGQTEPFTRANVSQDLDVHISPCLSPSCAVSGSCTGADIGVDSQGLLADSRSSVLPRSRYAGLPSDRGSTFGSHPRRYSKGRAMGDILAPGSRSHFQVPHQIFPKAATSFSRKQPEEVLYTYDADASPDNNQLNSDRNAPWLIQTHEHVVSDTKEFDMLKFSSSSPSALISRLASSLASAPGDLHLDQDKFDGDKDSGVGGSGSGFNERLTPSRELRKDKRIEMKPDTNTRTGLNGVSDGAVLRYDALHRPLTAKPIYNLGDGDISVLDHVAGIEHRDMGALENFGPLAFDLYGPASPISGSLSVAGVSGLSAVGSLFTRALGARSHIDDTDIPAHTSLDSRTTSTQSWSIDYSGGGEGELEECGLLKSLLESSDPWGLMKKKALNLPSPEREEVERRGKREKEDSARVNGSFGRRGVGYVTPPSMDALLGVNGTSKGVEMEEIWEGSDDDELEYSQEILDFRSSQPCPGLLLIFQRCRITQLIDILLVTRPSPSNIVSL